MNWKVAIAMGAGLLGGAAFVQALHAQAKGPILYVVDISEINDAEAFKAVGARSNQSAGTRITNLGGKYVVRTDKITAIDGPAPPKRMIVIAFDSMEKAQAFHNDPSQKEIDSIRNKTTKSRSFFVEGM
jgi:uncharacterized protein (DUF1330 family)